MRPASREVADVASLVDGVRARGETETRRRLAFDKDWDARFVAFGVKCESVEARLRDRHELSLEKCRAKLQQRLTAKPKRWTPQLEELHGKRRELMRTKRFSEALGLLHVVEAMEAREFAGHKKRVRKENNEMLHETFASQRDEIAVFNRERDAEEFRLNASRANALQRAVKNGFRGYEPVVDEEPGMSDVESDDEKSESENENENENQERRRRFMGKPNPNLVSNGAQRWFVTESGKTSTVTSPTPEGRFPAMTGSCPSSPSERIRFYQNRGGVADVMRLGTRAGFDSGTEDESGSGSRPGTGSRPETASRPEIPRAYDPTRNRRASNSGFEPDGSPNHGGVFKSAGQDSHYPGAYKHCFDRTVDEKALGFMVSDGQKGALAELHARRDASLRLWEREEREVLQSGASARPHAHTPHTTHAVKEHLELLHRVAASRGGVLFAGGEAVFPRREVTFPKPARRVPYGQTVQPHRPPAAGPPVDEARAAADAVHAAAVAMTGVGSNNNNHHHESTESRRRDEEPATSAVEAAEGNQNATVTQRDERTARDDGNGCDDDDDDDDDHDHDDSLNSEELDDLYLASPRRTANGGIGGITGIRVNLESVPGTFSYEPCLAPRGAGFAVGISGRSMAVQNVPTLKQMDGPTTRRFGSGTRAGIGQPRVGLAENDPYRDGPTFRRYGANLLKRMPGPDDCYRTERLGRDDPGRGERGFPSRNEDLREDADAPVGLKNSAVLKSSDETIILPRTEEPATRLPVRDTAHVAHHQTRVGVFGLRLGTDATTMGPVEDTDDETEPRTEKNRKENAQPVPAAAAAQPRLAAFGNGEDTALPGRRVYPRSLIPVFPVPVFPVPVFSQVKVSEPKQTPDHESSTYRVLRCAPVGHHLDSNTGLKVATLAAARVTERVGLSNGEVVVETAIFERENISLKGSFVGKREEARPAGSGRKPTAGPPGYISSSTDGTEGRPPGRSVVARIGNGSVGTTTDGTDGGHHTDVPGRVPLTSPERRLLFKHARRGEYDGVKILFKKRIVDPNALRDGHGNTLLLTAVGAGSGRVAKFLLKKGADVNCVNGKKNSALHFASR